MLSSLRAPLRVLLDPVAAALVRAGVSPDLVTVLGAVGVVGGSVVFVARGQLAAGFVVVVVSVLLDALDGAMARARGRSTRWGAFLDSSLDRVADGAVFAALAFWLGSADRPATAAAALLCLVGGFTVSYLRARAEGLGMRGDVGLAERGDRLVLAGLGGLGAIAGLPWALDVALWLLAALSVLTIGQRLLAVRVQARALDAADADGADAPVASG